MAASIESDGKRGSANVDTDGDPEHPLKTLAKAARLMNPVQFDLGKEISCNKPLPGEDRSFVACWLLVEKQHSCSCLFTDL